MAGGTLRHVGVTRAIQIIQALHRPRTIEALADRFGVTERTIHRDIVMLEFIGVRVTRREHDGFATFMLAPGDCPVCGDHHVETDPGELRRAVGAGVAESRSERSKLRHGMSTRHGDRRALLQLS